MMNEKPKRITGYFISNIFQHEIVAIIITWAIIAIVAAVVIITVIRMIF